MVFFSDKFEGADKTVFSDLAAELKHELIFAHSTMTTGLGKILFNYLNITTESDTVIQIISHLNGELA